MTQEPTAQPRWLPSCCKPEAGIQLIHLQEAFSDF